MCYYICIYVSEHIRVYVCVHMIKPSVDTNGSWRQAVSWTDADPGADLFHLIALVCIKDPTDTV